MEKELDKTLLIFEAESLLNEREALFEKIRTLKEEEEKTRKKGSNTEIRKANSELKKIDHLLDQIIDEEFDPIACTYALLKKQPSENSFQLFEKKLKEKEEEIFCIKNFADLLLPLCSKISHAKKLLLLPKRSFFQLFFQRHPKVLLAYAWEEILSEIKLKIPHLKSLAIPKAFEKKREESLHFLDDLKNEIEKRWNPTIYDKSFFALTDKIQEIYTEANKMLSQLQERQKSLLEEIHKWIASIH